MEFQVAKDGDLDGEEKKGAENCSPDGAIETEAGGEEDDAGNDADVIEYGREGGDEKAFVRLKDAS